MAIPQTDLNKENKNLHEKEDFSMNCFFSSNGFEVLCQYEFKLIKDFVFVKLVSFFEYKIVSQSIFY